MKFTGICGKQSARKHRQRGDYVIHLRGAPGRYTWLHVDTLDPTTERLTASQVRQQQRAAGKTIVYALVDDAWASHGLQAGDRYWPKRRNQHSKPYEIMEITPQGMIRYQRGDDFGVLLPSNFLAVVGKRVGE